MEPQRLDDRPPRNQSLSRRVLLAGGAGVAARLAATGEAGARNERSMTSNSQADGSPSPRRGRLLSRPGPPTDTLSPGLHRLGLAPERDAVLYVPDGYRPERPAPFVLALHGAGGNAAAGLYPLGELADEYGCLLLAPAARRQTWDVIRGALGPDVSFLDQALAWAFARCAVDPARLAIAGFSDGASYALTLGVTNGDLFGHVMAFSPGFVAPEELHGDPRIFISHGTRDEVLPIASTSHRLVQLFTLAQYDLTYREFDGGHTVPPEIAREAMNWFLAPPVTDEPAATPLPAS